MTASQVKTLDVAWIDGDWNVGEFPPHHEPVSDRLYRLIRPWARFEFLLNKHAWEHKPQTTISCARFQYAPFGPNTLPTFNVDEDGELLSARLIIAVEYDVSGCAVGFKL